MLPLLFLCTLGFLASLPHLATASDQEDNAQGNSAHHHTDHETGHEENNENENEADHQIICRFSHPIDRRPASTHLLTRSASDLPTNRLLLNGTSSAIAFRVVVCDTANVTHSHIHVGATWANGPIALPFFDQPSNPFSSPHGCNTLAHGVRGPADLMTNAGEGVGNWTGFVHALLSGNTYVNVHATTHPGGEIRARSYQSKGTKTTKKTTRALAFGPSQTFR